MIELRTAFLGLVTDSSDMQAGPGALVRAENVVLHKQGLIEPRPGVVIDLEDMLLPTDIIRIEPYESANVIVAAGGLYTTTYGLLAFTDPFGADQPYYAVRTDLVPYEIARGILFQGGMSRGLLRWDQAFGSTGLRLAGVLPLFSMFAAPVSPDPDGFLPDSSQVAYRVVMVRKNAVTGYETRSRPSGASVAESPASGGPFAVTVQIDVTATDPEHWTSLEIYRTRVFPLTVPPDAEYQLVGTLQRDDVAIPSFHYQFEDKAPDSQRGAVLYTSPSREGEEGANDPPPFAQAMGMFKGALFLGNTQGPRARSFSVNISSTPIPVGTPGVGQRHRIATLVGPGSDQITGVSFASEIKPGMLIAVVGGGIPDHTYVTNVVGSTVTMSAEATLGGPGADLTFYDALWYGPGPTDYYRAEELLSNASLTFGDSAYGYAVVPPAPGYTTTWVIQSIYSGPEASTLELNATNGAFYTPALPEFGSPPDFGEQDINLNKLVWSKPDEPEAFPPINYAFVGERDRRILSLVPTRDALFIFKEDGTWRLTGIPGQYRIDPFDLTTVCVSPGSVVPLRNQIIMLASKGIVAVSDEGVQLISAPFGTQLMSMCSRLLQNYDVAYILSGYITYPGAASDLSNEYYLFVGGELQTEESKVTAPGMLVYSDDTKSWVSWSFNPYGDYGIEPVTLAFNDRRAALYIAQRNPRNTRLLRFARPYEQSAFILNALYRCDGEAPVTMTDMGGGMVSFSPPIVVLAEDYVRDANGEYWRCVSGGAGQSSVESANGATFANGDGVYFRTIVCTVRPRAFLKPVPVVKQWTQFTAQFSQIRFMGRVLVRAASSLSVGAYDMVEQPFATTGIMSGISLLDLGASLRAIVPTVANRGWRALFELSWVCLAETQALEAMLVETVDSKTNVVNLEVNTL